MAIAMGISVAYGLSAAVGLAYTPISVILPFLCLGSNVVMIGLSQSILTIFSGIGIDDMFVVMQCWNNVGTESAQMNRSTISSRISQALKHAGVAMTVTSLTDVFAFGIGAVTVRFCKKMQLNFPFSKH